MCNSESDSTGAGEPARISWATLLLGLALAGISSVARGAEPALQTQGFAVRCLAITGARVVAAPGREIENGRVILRDGRIEAVGGPEIPVPVDAEELKADGLVVYAGFIDAAYTGWLPTDARSPEDEGRAVDSARQALAGMREAYYPGIVPQWQAAERLKPTEESLEKLRQQGFCAVHVTPTHGFIAGQGALASTGTAPRRETLLEPVTFVPVNLFTRVGNEYPSTLMGVHALLRQSFLDAARHSQQLALSTIPASKAAPPAFDPVLTELARMQRGELPVLFSAQSRDDIERSVALARELGLKPSVWGVKEGWKSLPGLKDLGTGLIADVSFGDEPKIDPPEANKEGLVDPLVPERVRKFRHAEWKERTANLARLHEAGLKFGLSSRDLKQPDQVHKHLRQAIQAGLPREAALAALTSNAAELLGAGDRLGTLDAGKLGHVIILSGPFDDERSRVRHVVIDDRRYEYHKDAKPVPAESESEKTVVDVAGTWQVEIDGADGKLRGTLELVQVKQGLSGRFSSDQGDGKIASGSTSAESFEFVVAIGAGDRAVQLKFSGKKTDAGLEGTLKSAFGAPVSWTASQPETPPPADNPIALSGLEESPADASQPQSGAETPAIVAGEQPTELPPDRLARPLQTGGSVLVRGLTILTGTGTVLENASILVQAGKIVAIGPEVEAPAGVTVIDGAGRFAMPGVVDTHNHMMISAGAGLGGVNEATDSIVCEVRVRDSVHTDDISEYRTLAAGVTTARLLHGSANTIGGQDAIVQLKYGADIAGHLLPDSPQGVKFALGENVKRRTGRFPNTRLGVEATIHRAFVEALEYRRNWQEYDRQKQAAGEAGKDLLPPRRDLRLEALVGIIESQIFIHSHCYRADEILMLLRSADKVGVRVRSLQHVLEGYKVAPEIARHGASCSTFSDHWGYKVEAFDAVPHNAALLHAAGINTVIKSDFPVIHWPLRWETARTIRHGNMPPDAALQAVTRNPARELGIDDRVGTLEVGKQGDFALYNGHPLSAFSRCEMTFIGGECYFIREKQPSAMTAATVERTKLAAPLTLPAPEERKPVLSRLEHRLPKIALVGATLHPVDGPEIVNGMLLIEGELIKSIGQGPGIPADATVIDCQGLHIYPGLIDAGSMLGLNEIGSVQETHDTNEAGLFQPDLLAGTAINPDSELLPVARADGITSALIRPLGGVISGQAALMQPAGWTAPDMVIEPAVGLQIQWPGAKDRKKVIDELRQLLTDARVYDKVRSAPTAEGQPRVVEDPRFEALRPYIKGERTVFIEAVTRVQILEALQFAKDENLKLVLTGSLDGWKVAKEIAEQQVPVILGSVMRAPLEDFDPLDAPLACAGLLHEAGVKVCFRSNSAALARHLPLEAGVCVAYGLPEDVALKGVTWTSAEVLGVADRLGSLTPGKWANLIITDGSPLQPTTQYKGIYIRGQGFAPENRQTRLYEKYKERLVEKP